MMSPMYSERLFRLSKPKVGEQPKSSRREKDSGRVLPENVENAGALAQYVNMPLDVLFEVPFTQKCFTAVALTFALR